MTRLIERIRHVFGRTRRDAEMSAEIQAHINALTERNFVRGMTAEEARYAALREFGGVEQIKERCRDEARRGTAWLESWLQDLAYGVRTLRKSPGYTLLAVGTLAAGTGAATTLFSVVDGALLHPFPYRHASSIYQPFFADARTLRRDPQESYAEFQQVSQLPAVEEAIAASVDEDEVVRTDNLPTEDIDGVLVSPNTFDFLGVPPLLGRTIGGSDLLPNGAAQPVVVLSYAFWQRAFGGDPHALGRTVSIRGLPHTVIGVMPPRFAWFTNHAFWLPLPHASASPSVETFVRLKSGASLAAATDQLRALQLRWAHAHPDAFPRDGFTSGFATLLDATAGTAQLRTRVRLLGFAVAFLVLIACANVANLQLARATVRSREIALRVALGAPRTRVLRQLLLESVLLSTGASLLGLALTAALIRVVMAWLPHGAVPAEANIVISGTVLLFSVGIAVTTGLLSGLAAAWPCHQIDVIAGLKTGDRTSSQGAATSRLRSLFAAIQIALSVVLVSGAALTARGFLELEHLDLGFRQGGLLRLRIPKDPHRYATMAQSLALDRALVESVRKVPGVASASIGNVAFPLPGGTTRFGIDGGGITGEQRMLFGLIDGAFLETMRVRLVRGRAISVADVAAARPVCLITEAAARLWPAGTDPIGRPLRLSRLAEPSEPGNLAPEHLGDTVTVVGIIGNLRLPGVLDAAPPAVFVPVTLRAPGWRMLALRTATNPTLILNEVRRQVQRIDPDLPVDEASTAGKMIAEHMRSPRFNLLVFASLAVVALLLSVAGVAGVLSYTVARRTREFGVRAALGATPADIAGLVIRSTARLLAIGLIIGCLVTAALSQFVTSAVFIRSRLDPVTEIAAIAAIAVAAIIASIIPARRAANVDPVTALRTE